MKIENKTKIQVIDESILDIAKKAAKTLLKNPQIGIRFSESKARVFLDILEDKFEACLEITDIRKELQIEKDINRKTDMKMSLYHNVSLAISERQKNQAYLKGEKVDWKEYNPTVKEQINDFIKEDIFEEDRSF